MIAVALKEKEIAQDLMVQEHHASAQEVIACILGLGGHGRMRIALLKDQGEDGKDNPKRL